MEFAELESDSNHTVAALQQPGTSVTKDHDHGIEKLHSQADSRVGGSADSKGGRGKCSRRREQESEYCEK